MKASERVMVAAKKVKMLLVENEITITELAQKLGTTQPNISGKMKRDNFSEKELTEIANVLGAKVEINFILEDGRKI